MKNENKLIAEFMGLEEPFELPQHGTIRPNGEFKTEFTVEQLKYDKSWEWLMPVVDKIEELEYFVHVLGDGCIIYDGECPKIIRTGSRKEATYKAVVEFIK